MPTYFHYTPVANLAGVLSTGLQLRNPHHASSPYHADAGHLGSQPVGVYACLSAYRAAFWGVDIYIACRTALALVAFSSESSYIKDPCDVAACVLSEPVPAESILFHHVIEPEEFAAKQWLDPGYKDLFLHQDAMTEFLTEHAAYLLESECLA